MSNINKKNKIKFKSYVDITNYNNFLLELDKQNTNKIYGNESKINGNTNDKTINKTNDKPPNDILNTLKEIEDTYEKGIKNPNITGITAFDTLLEIVEKNIDPNLFDMDEETNIKNINKTIPNTNIPKNKVNIVTEINNINDLLVLIDTYPVDSNTEYNINMKSLHKIKKPLTELNNMVGMKDLKENIVDQIIFYIQNLHTLKTEIKGNDFMHTVIYGPPGTGKTEIAKLIGSIFAKLGILTKETFKKVTRADLIAGYLGQTALKTRDTINECLGGVLFIDEAYALGNEEKRDSFSKECIDTLCEALSDHKDNLMVIVAGYETDLNNCFFNYNQGLNSRFTWRFKTDEYNAEDLYNIFLKKVKENEWFLAENSGIDVKWFEKHKKHFKFYGRDIETLFAKTKITHSRRVFCLELSVKKYITINDLDKGLEVFLKNEDSTEKQKEKTNKILSSMYI
jgi:SpoVK/Ycf46/Vps4 family AAA+-type ATPase